MINRVTRSFSVFLLFWVMFFALAVTSYAQQPPATVSLEPTAIEVGLGETVDVAVMAHDVQDLYGFDLELALNNAQAIEIVDAEPNTEGTQIGFGTFLDSGFSLLNQVDQSTGAVRFAMTQVNPSKPKNGSGTLVVLTLRGLQTGASAELSLTHAELGQPRGVTFESNINSTPLQVTVVEATTQGTPIPKQNTTDAGVAEALGTPVSLTHATNQSTQENSSFMLLAGVAFSIILLLVIVILVLMIRLRRRESM